MFEGIISQILTNVLSDLIEGITPEQLKIQILSGIIELHNLELKKNCLNFLNLPISIKRGVLGDLEVKIPWKDLLNKPIEITLRNIIGLVNPQKIFEFNEEKLKEQLEKDKKNKLDEYEIKKTFEETKNEEDGIKNKLIGKIIENIKITVENIHFQFIKDDFENEIENNKENNNKENNEKNSMIFGITIESIQVNTIKNPSIENQPIFKYKIVELNNFSMYCIPEYTIKNNYRISTKEFITTMKNNIILPYSNQSEYKNWILLNPTNFNVIIGINLSNGFKIEYSKVLGQINFSETKIEL